MFKRFNCTVRLSDIQLDRSVKLREVTHVVIASVIRTVSANVDASTNAADDNVIIQRNDKGPDPVRIRLFENGTRERS